MATRHPKSTTFEKLSKTEQARRIAASVASGRMSGETARAAARFWGLNPKDVRFQSGVRDVVPKTRPVAFEPPTLANMLARAPKTPAQRRKEQQAARQETLLQSAFNMTPTQRMLAFQGGMQTAEQIARLKRQRTSYAKALLKQATEQQAAIRRYDTARQRYTTARETQAALTTAKEEERRRAERLLAEGDQGGGVLGAINRGVQRYVGDPLTRFWNAPVPGIPRGSVPSLGEATSGYLNALQRDLAGTYDWLVPADARQGISAGMAQTQRDVQTAADWVTRQTAKSGQPINRSTQAAGFAIPPSVGRAALSTVRTGTEALVGLGPGLVYAAAHPGEAYDQFVAAESNYYGRLAHGDFSVLEEQGLTPAIMDAFGILGGVAGGSERAGAIAATNQYLRSGGDLVMSTEGRLINPATAYGRAAILGQRPTSIIGAGDVTTMGRRVPIRLVMREARLQEGDTFQPGDVALVRDAEGKTVSKKVTTKSSLRGQRVPDVNDPYVHGDIQVVGGLRPKKLTQRMAPRSRLGEMLTDLYAKTPAGKRLGYGRAKLRQELEVERDRQMGALQAFRSEFRDIQGDPVMSTAFDRMIRFPEDPVASIDAEIAARRQRGLDQTPEQQQALAALEQAREIVANPPERLQNAVGVGREIANQTEDFLLQRGLISPTTAARARVDAQRWLVEGGLEDPPLESPKRTAMEETLSEQLGEGGAKLGMAFTDTVARAWGRREGRNPVEWYDEHIQNLKRVSQDEMQGHIENEAAAALQQIKNLDVVFEENRKAANRKMAEDVRSGKKGAPAQAPRVFRKFEDKLVQIVGPISPKNWVTRIDHIFSNKQRLRDLGMEAIGRPFKSKKEAIDYYAKWYEHYEPVFRAVFKGLEGTPLNADAIMRAFSVSQANASPASGLQAVLRVADKLFHNQPVGPKEISTVAQGIETAMKGEPITRFVAAKLSDFIDSLAGKETRTWLGDVKMDPAAIDIHAMRDLGRIDKKIINKLRERWNIEGTVDVGGSPNKTQYETMAAEYQAIADHLNEQRYNGRKDWTATQVQALGWSGIQLLHGVVPEDLGFAFRANTRRVLFQVTHGPTGIGSDLTAPEANAVIARIQPDIEEIVASRNGQVVDMKVQIGGWDDGTQATAMLDVAGSPEAVQAITRDLATAYDQESVIAVRPGGNDKNGRMIIEIFNDAFRDTRTADLYWRNLRAAIKEQKTGIRNKALKHMRGFEIFTHRDGRVGMRIITEATNLKIGAVAGDAKYDAAMSWIHPLVDRAAIDAQLDVTVQLRNASRIKGDAWREGDTSGLHPGRSLDDPALLRARENLLDAVESVRGARTPGTEQGRLPVPELVRGGPRALEESLRSAAGRDLEGLPAEVEIPADHPAWSDPIEWHSNRELQDLAEQYAAQAGIDYTPIRVYAPVDPLRAERIAVEFQHMLHAPNDPVVRASYEAFMRETLAQYQMLADRGYTFEFMPPGIDPYRNSPRLAQADWTQNKHLYVFPTDEGYGLSGITDEMRAENPLLQETGLTWSGRPVLYNDLFRAVHDIFGHFKEGVGFRETGEENAWRSHSAMYSPEARGAMTTETRGQNSWLNFGNYGPLNRQAKTYATVFADQKIGLLPDWVIHDGAADPTPRRRQAALAQTRKARGQQVEIETKTFGAAVIKQNGVDILLDMDDADLGTFVHEVFHVALPDWLDAAQRAGDARADHILTQHLGLPDAAALKPREGTVSQAMHDQWIEAQLQRSGAEENRASTVPQEQRRSYNAKLKKARAISDRLVFDTDLDVSERAALAHQRETLRRQAFAMEADAPRVGEVHERGFTKRQEDAHELLARTGDAWLRRGGALPAPQLRTLMAGLSNELRESYRSGIMRDIARTPEEGKAIMAMLDDPVVTSVLRDMLDIAPLRDFDPSVVSFVTMRNMGALSTKGRLRTAFKGTVLPERHPPTKGPNTFAAWDAGTADVGPDMIAHYAAAEVRGRVQNELALRVKEFEEPFEFDANGRPILKPGYQVYNYNGIARANAILDQMFRRSQRYGDLGGEKGAIEDMLSGDPTTGSIVDLHPDDYSDLIDVTVSRVLAEEMLDGSVDAAAKRVGNYDEFLQLVREGKVTQVRNDTVEMFLAASGGAYLFSNVGAALSAIGSILRIPNMLARWRMILKPAYSILNAGQTGILAGLHQGPFLAANAANLIKLSRRTRLRMLSGVGAGTAELSDFARIPGEGRLARFQRGESELFTRAMHKLAWPENQIRLTQMTNDLHRSGYRSEADINRLYDAALAGNEQARLTVSQIERWAEDAVVRFRGMSPEESAVIRDMVFVYGWLRAAARFTLQFPLNRPATAALGFHVGQYGWEKLHEQFFALAREQEGTVVAGKRKIANDFLVKVIDVGQWLPFKTGADVLTPFLSLVTDNGELKPATFADLLSPSLELGVTAVYGGDPRYGTSLFDQIKGTFDWKNLPLAYWVSRFIDPAQSGNKLKGPQDRLGVLLTFFGGMAAPYEIKASTSYQRWLAQQDPITRTLIREQNDSEGFAALAEAAAQARGESISDDQVRAINADTAYTVFSSLLEDKFQKKAGDEELRLTAVQRAAAKSKILQQYYPDAWARANDLTSGDDVGSADGAAHYSEIWNDYWSSYVSDTNSDTRSRIKDTLGLDAPKSVKVPLDRWRRDITWVQTAPPESIARIRKAMKDQGVKPGNRLALEPIIESEMERAVAVG